MILPVDPARFAAYLAVMSAMCFFPGPANLFSVATGLTRGRAAMLAGVAGMNLANLTWYVLAALGLGALTRTVPGVFHLLRIGGAAYLLWLAHEAWKGRHAPIEGPADGPAPAPRRRSAFRDGFVVQITNPKALLFFTAVLPPFLDMQRPLVPQLVIFGPPSIIVDCVSMTAYGIGGASLAARMQDATFKRRFAIVTALLLVSAAALVALSV